MRKRRRGKFYATRWHDSYIKAYRQALEELAEAGKKIKEKRDYLDLLDIHISQILSRDMDFLEPLLKELDSFFEAKENDLTCIDCKEKFTEWLRDVREDFPEEGQ